jgi:hypothetical protein
MFEASYQLLSVEHPQWGRVATLPWDEKVFGFPVGDYQAGDSRSIAITCANFRENLANWAEKNRVELVGCSIAADDILWCTLLPELGFTFVDYTLKISQPRLQTWEAPPSKLPVRLAQLIDEASIESIAQHAFRAGRYHMDPRFPRPLSELRYKHWLSNALAASGPTSRLYVTGEEGHATGFFHVNLDGDAAYITIIAVALDKQGTRTGIDLCAGALRDLKSIGIRRMSSKVSAMNSGVLNLAIYLGWRVSDPQAVFHWHAPNGPHLVKRDDVFA